MDEEQPPLPFEPRTLTLAEHEQAVIAEADRDFGARSMLARKWLEFHHEHPEIYELFVKYTRRVVTRGFKHFGIGAIAERVRWEVALEQRDDSGFKINNNHRAYYARLIARVHPELAIFQMRELGGGTHVAP